jgi:hypothetical protein
MPEPAALGENQCPVSDIQVLMGLWAGGGPRKETGGAKET